MAYQLAGFCVIDLNEVNSEVKTQVKSSQVKNSEILELPS